MVEYNTHFSCPPPEMGGGQNKCLVARLSVDNDQLIVWFIGVVLSANMIFLNSNKENIVRILSVYPAPDHTVLKSIVDYLKASNGSSSVHSIFR